MQNSLFESNGKEKSYVVLARKYRPLTFKEIAGQDITVQTLQNFFKNKRIPHAFIFTGIRGIGKTTIARIISKGLNCTGNGNMDPTFDPCLQCVDCKAILKSTHSDVLEIDAASHTSVNDVRELIENAKYTPISGRYKVYIIDEVHMLSNSAFNALLKTLEEPPAHVKFILATTEIQKIPVTVLSRCQKFRLRLLKLSELEKYYNTILEKEKYTIEQSALTLIAKSAKGSVRDGLSVLDQAVVMSDSNKIYESTIKEMLSLADTGNLYTLFHKIVSGDIKNSIKIVRDLYEIGIDPVFILENLLQITHNITKFKIIGNTDNLNLLYVEISLIQNIAKNLEVSFLSRLWDMLSQGANEIKFSNMPLEFLEILLVKIVYVNIHETPENILKKIKEKKSNIATNNNDIEDFSTPLQLLQLAQDKDDMMLYYTFRNEIAFIELKNGYMKIASKNKTVNISELKDKLFSYTNISWDIELDKKLEVKTIAEEHQSSVVKLKEEITKNNLVQDVLNTFTESKIADIKISDDDQI